MFKKTKVKIVAAIMSVLVLLWAGTLSVIYLSSYFEMSRRNAEMLRAHVDAYTSSEQINPLPPKPKPGGDKGRFENSPMFQLSTFYTVLLDKSGEAVEIKNNRPSVHTDSDLLALARSVSAEKRQNGKIKGLVYYKTAKGENTLVAFMDNTIVNESATTLFRYTLIFGASAILLLFFLSFYLAKRIVDPLERSYKKQRQFISDAGHELKTPVSVVNANAELLSRELGENVWLDNIKYENERMGTLVGQLLELARTESVPLCLERIDLSRLARGEALPFESIAFERGITLETQIEDGVFVSGDSTRLKQLVSILLDNAVRHSKGDTVTLALSSERGHARLAVANGADEIPKEEREQLFERFYRLDRARSGEDGHYGLGLSIAKAITDSHGGKIEVNCFDGLVEFCVILNSD